MPIDNNSPDDLNPVKPRRGAKLVEAVAANEMPREKLLAQGAEALTDVDLIAIMLRTGIVGMNVMELARSLYNYYGGNIARMGDATVAEIMQVVKGIGEAKAIAFVAALELGRRRQFHAVKDIPLKSPEAVYRFFAARIGNNVVEEFHLAVIDNGGKVLHAEMVTRGGLSSTAVDCREVFSKVLRWRGTGFVVAHNHPGGNPNPSQSDIDLTKRLKDGAKILGLRFLDHVIVVQGRGEGAYYSFQENKLL